MTTLEVVGLVVLSYLIGSLPFGYAFGKLVKGRGYDIRDHGSNSIGATNVLRVLGWKIGIPVFILDALKGYGPALLGMKAVSPAFGGLCLLAAALGHAFSLYFYWREGRLSGGKSVATYFGGLLALQPVVALVGLGVFLLTVAITRYVSLGSMVGALGALICGIAIGLTAAWIWILIAVFLLIVFLHRRNIARLFEGCENKLGEHVEEEGAVSAFAFHALSIEDFRQTKITGALERLIQQGIITERQARWLITRGPILEVGQITDIEFPDGTGGRVLLMIAPLLPDQIKDPNNLPLLEKLLRSMAVQAKRRGASVLTLGALLSTFGNGGQDLQDWCNKRQLGLVIDNGAGATGAATIAMLEQMLRDNQFAKKKTLADCILAIIGASGIIGHILVRYFRKRASGVIAIARDERKMADLTDKATLITTDLEKIVEADVIISTTSAVEPIIHEGNIDLVKDGCVIGDVAVPSDVKPSALRDRPDISLGRSGQFLLPGRPRVAVNFHFGEVDGNYLVPACLVQGLILAKTKRFEYASCGMSGTDEVTVNFFREQFELLGFEMFVTDHCEPEIFGVA